mgnify:CR=1 FL=1
MLLLWVYTFAPHPGQKRVPGFNDLPQPLHPPPPAGLPPPGAAPPGFGAPPREGGPPPNAGGAGLREGGEGFGAPTPGLGGVGDGFGEVTGDGLGDDTGEGLGEDTGDGLGDLNPPVGAGLRGAPPVGDLGEEEGPGCRGEDAPPPGRSFGAAPPKGLPNPAGAPPPPLGPPIPGMGIPPPPPPPPPGGVSVKKKFSKARILNIAQILYKIIRIKQDKTQTNEKQIIEEKERERVTGHGGRSVIGDSFLKAAFLEAVNR